MREFKIYDYVLIFIALFFIGSFLGVFMIKDIQFYDAMNQRKIEFTESCEKQNGEVIVGINYYCVKKDSLINIK